MGLSHFCLDFSKKHRKSLEHRKNMEHSQMQKKSSQNDRVQSFFYVQGFRWTGLILMILYFSSQYDFTTGHCTDLESILYFSPKFQNFSYLSYSSNIYKVGFCTKVEKNTSAKYVQKYYSNANRWGIFKGN